MRGAEQRKNPLRERERTNEAMRDVFVLASATYVTCGFRTAFLDGVKVSHNRHGHESVDLSSWTIVRRNCPG
jgi:hypothetical protein